MRVKKLNPLHALQEKESPVGPEAGVDPLPGPVKGPLDPLYKAWTAVGAYPLAVALTAGAFFPSVPLSLVVPFERFMNVFPRQLMGLVPRLTLSKCRVTYHPEFDPGRVSMFMMNHTSMLDAHVACWAIPSAFCGIMHAHHFKVPVYGWLMRAGNGIGVVKGESGQAGQVAEQVADRVRRGVSILGFPEGRRTQSGRILPFRKGLFVMARDSGLPVVPLCVRGLWAIFPRGEWVVRPGQLEVFVGPQIETAGRSDAEIEVMARRFEDFTRAFVERGELGEVAALGR